MGRADVCESDYLENGEIFADLVNGVLYQGEQVVKACELEERDGELRSILGKDAKKTLRDKVKLWKGTVIAVLVVENQTKVDYRMVTRAMLAESMAYDKQWKKLRDKNRARNLYELLDVEGNEEKVLPFISNYRLNLFDYHDYDDFDRFRSELQLVFEFMRYSGDKESMKARMEQHREKYESLSSEAKVLLTELTNIKEIPGVKEEEFKKGDFNMCKAFEDMRKEGFIEGEKVGEKKGEIKGRAKEIIEIGYEFKLSKEDILQRLQNKLSISLEKAQEYFRIYGKQTIK